MNSMQIIKILLIHRYQSKLVHVIDIAVCKNKASRNLKAHQNIYKRICSMLIFNHPTNKMGYTN